MLISDGNYSYSMSLTFLQLTGPGSFMLQDCQVLNAGGYFSNNNIISFVVINNCSAQTHERRACFLPFHSDAARQRNLYYNYFSPWEIQCVAGVRDKRPKSVTVILNAWDLRVGWPDSNSPDVGQRLCLCRTMWDTNASRWSKITIIIIWKNKHLYSAP